MEVTLENSNGLVSWLAVCVEEIRLPSSAFTSCAGLCRTLSGSSRDCLWCSLPVHKAVSLRRAPGERHTEPHGKDSGGHTGDGVDGGEPRLAFLDQ